MDYVRIFVNWVVCGHWCQLLNEYFQQTKSVDLSELRCVDISELCYLWSLVGFSNVTLYVSVSNLDFRFLYLIMRTFGDINST